jgi:RimJ/RimL family protein N-acetyltransferase
MMGEADWLEQHARVLFETDGRGRITRVNAPDPETEPPRVFLARGRASTLIVFRADVPDDIASELALVASSLATWDGQPTDTRTLDPLREAGRAWLEEAVESHGPAFRFEEIRSADVVDEVVFIDEANAHLLDVNFAYTRSVLDWRSPVAGIVRNGAVVSACYSARRRATACEAGVDTVEPYRGRGLAVAVVSAWARAVQAAGMTPLYSTSWDNKASLRVAAKLGLKAYADTLSFE